MNSYLKILEISKSKNNIISIYLDKKIITEEVAYNLCKNYQMEISKNKRGEVK